MPVANVLPIITYMSGFTFRLRRRRHSRRGLARGREDARAHVLRRQLGAAEVLWVAQREGPLAGQGRRPRSPRRGPGKVIRIVIRTEDDVAAPIYNVYVFPGRPQQQGGGGPHQCHH